jgi:DNA mismatch repair protein MutS2
VVQITPAFPFSGGGAAVIASLATLQALELPRLLATVAELAVSDLGREWVLERSPLAAAEVVASHRRRLEEAMTLVAEGGVVGEPDMPLRPLLERIASGHEAPAPLGLVRLADLLETARKGEQRLLAERERFPALGALRSELALDPSDAERADELVRAIGRTLDGKGEIRDAASPRLLHLRRAVQSRREALYAHTSEYIKSHRDVLGEETAAFRDGRLSVLLPVGERGRLPGLVHARSASGKSFYFEPLEMVEPNNELQQATAEEAEERRRLLQQLQSAAHEARSSIARYGELLRTLDGLQALVRYAGLLDCAEPAPARPGELVLTGARHPLLDGRLADLRRSALGSAGHRGEVVPLDLDFGERRALVLTGPNAGGKTVALKTLGLAVLAHQAGLPVPCAIGTRIPVFTSLVAVVGDQQDLLADRSTFSARLERFAEAWEEAGPGSLILVDEMGSGTNPREGAALANAFLDGLLERGGLALMTTHLTELAARALDLPGAGCLAMELDPASHVPTFRLRSGPPAGSEALALARRLGLPAAWLDHAESFLSPEQRELSRLLEETERLRQELEERRDELGAELVRQRQTSERLEEEERRLEEERRSLKGRSRDALAELRRGVEDRLEAELERLAEEAAVKRQPLGERRKRSLARAGADHLLEDLPPLLREDEDAGPDGELGAIETGSWVAHRSLGWEGRVERLGRGRAEVVVRGKRLRCPIDDLRPARVPRKPTRSPQPIAGPPPRAVPGELNLIGRRVEGALEEVDRYLDQALLASTPTVRVVHGHGSGRLRAALREHLRRHAAVVDLAPAPPSQGGDGATVVTLREER